jgi:hypothetical protein
VGFHAARDVAPLWKIACVPLLCHTLVRVAWDTRSHGIHRETSPSPSNASAPVPHLRRDLAHRCNICAGTGLAPRTSAPGSSSPEPTSAQGTGLTRQCGGMPVPGHSHWAAAPPARRCATATRCPGPSGRRVRAHQSQPETKPGLGADVGGVSPVPVQMWKG